MSSPSHPQPPAAPAPDKPPSTQEIPVAAPTGATAAAKTLPPHPDAAPPAPVSPVAPQPTGPVDFVPGPPGVGTPPVPPPAPASAPPPVPPSAAPQPAPAGAQDVPEGSTRSWPDTLESDTPAVAGGEPGVGRMRGLDRTAILGLGLAGLALVLVLLGIGLDFGTESYWSAVPLWSVFATLCAVLGLLAFAAFYPAGNRFRSAPMERVAAAALAGLSVFWLLVVLPHVDSDRGFLLTAALACLGGSLWIGPRRHN